MTAATRGEGGAAGGVAFTGSVGTTCEGEAGVAPPGATRSSTAGALGVERAGGVCGTDGGGTVITGAETITGADGLAADSVRASAGAGLAIVRAPVGAISAGGAVGRTDE